VMKIALLWDVMPRSLVASYNRFWGNFCNLLQGINFPPWT
jgi:hypothetical protein